MRSAEVGTVGWILLLILGIPIPVLAVMFFMQVCT
jgi:hypothetical protein